MVPLLEELRQSIEASRFTIRGENRPSHKPRAKARPPGGKKQVAVTVSIGAAHRSRFHPTPEAVVKAADEALYRAKRMGRNRVEAEKRIQPRESYVKRIRYRDRKKEEWPENKVTKRIKKRNVGSIAP
jgi:hypothetical protein